MSLFDRVLVFCLDCEFKDIVERVDNEGFCPECGSFQFNEREITE
jgi:Zn finger protein HypA/HybF involved in hydrogenase expression